MNNNLKKLRVNRKLSLRKLGEMCGRSGAQMHQLEQKLSSPTLKTAYSISKVLNVPVEEIWPNEVEFEEETITVRRVKT